MAFVGNSLDKCFVQPLLLLERGAFFDASQMHSH